MPADADPAVIGLPVNLPVQTPQGSLHAGLQLPAPSTMLRQLDAARRAAYSPVDLTVLGSDYSSVLPQALVTADGMQAQFSPDWHAPTAGLAGLAYACYPFTLTDYDLASGLKLTWTTQPANPADCYVGLGNMLSDRWDWYQCNAAGVISTPGFHPYIEVASDRLLAVVAVVGTTPARLLSLSVSSGISGVVTNTAGAPIPRVQVSVPGYGTFTTNLSGEFNAWGMQSSERLAVTFKAEGYVDTTFMYNVAPGTDCYASVRMLQRSAPVSIDAATGGVVPIGGGGKITLPPAALVDSTGAPLTGMLQANLTFLDVTDEALLRAAPGDFSAVQLDSSETRLETFGITEIAIQDGRGQQANLAPGQTAQVQFPIPAAQQATAPATMGLYSFDEASGDWLETGTLAKDGTGKFYEGEVSHFSLYNCDRAYITTCIKVKVVDALDQPVPGVRVLADGVDYRGFDIGWTDINGVACLEARTASHVKVFYDYRDIICDPVEVETGSMVKLCNDPFADCELKQTFALAFPPQGLLIADPVQGDPPLTVTFNAGGSFDRDGAIVKYEWDYDGSANGYSWFDSGANPSVQYTYNNVGAYSAAIRLTDNLGHTALAGVDIYSGLNGGNGGDWWMYNHDPQHSCRSAYIGPLTANKIWTFTGTNSIGTNPVLAGDGTIYVSVRGVGLHAINPTDGAVNWQTPAFGADNLSTPAVGTDGTIYMGCYDWGMRALSPITGDVKWIYWAGDLIQASLAIGYNGTLYIPSNDGKLHAVDGASGAALWQFDTNTEYVTDPAIGLDGTIFVRAVNGVLYALSPDGVLKWSEAVLDGGVGSIAVVPSVGPDGTVYQSRSKPGVGGLAALDPATGEELWRCTLPGGVYLAEVPAIGADGTLYIGGNMTDPEPHSAIFALNGATGGVLWQGADIAGYIHTAPCIDASGKLYVTTSSSKLACLSGTDGSEIWSYALPGSYTTTPSIGDDGTLYVSCTGGLLAFRDP